MKSGRVLYSALAWPHAACSVWVHGGLPAVWKLVTFLGLRQSSSDPRADCQPLEVVCDPLLVTVFVVMAQ